MNITYCDNCNEEIHEKKKIKTKKNFAVIIAKEFIKIK